MTDRSGGDDRRRNGRGDGHGSDADGDGRGSGGSGDERGSGEERREGSYARICCCLRPGEDRRLLVEWLDRHGYDPVVAAPDELSTVAFDCCLVDVASLRAAEGALRAARIDGDGIRPCLLVAPGDASAALAALPDSAADVVTDVLGTPLRSVVLCRRLEGALSVRRLSAALAGSRERYRRLIERTPAAVFLLSDGVVVYRNAEATRLLAPAAEAVDGTRFISLIAESDRDRVASLLDGLSSDGETGPVEASIVGGSRSIPTEIAATAVDDGPAEPTDGPADGPTRGPDVAARQGIPDADVQVVVHDVSRRRAREDQLRLYRRAMDTATVGMTITNPSLPDNPLVYVNDEFVRLTGWSHEEVLGRNPRLFQCADTDPETIARVRRAIDEGEPVSVELLNERADGTRWYNALDVAPIHGPDGAVEYFLGFQRDVTDRREREIRLAVLDRVLRHNLRNRLNVVLGHVAELEDEADDPAFHTARIRSAAESLLSLSDAARRFRSILHGRDGTDDPLRLDHAVADALATLRSAHPGAIVDATLMPATVRSGAGVTVAVEELVTNAIDHCDRDPEVTVTVEREGDDAVLSVADNGPGIPPQERPSLTGGQETPIEHASGLGLWLVRWVVDDAGGSVSYADNDPRGAVVSIRLPIVAEDGQEPERNDR
ncbi:PAS domain S-box protein [Halorubrum sp. JWXQ-INN 858]|uniref:PAS domain S-box protein n=1 Tax=Halorubrum sp. JWXQ-INN 858 TaxID=2690782 RepID=UPI00135734F0|nr:PAS domain S-box protein [Halorubrum sp. JWXQ-INN 858]MWV65286.1 PAS domain S-box protein [Halorubrum sp. JWXQ-INN 858]